MRTEKERIAYAVNSAISTWADSVGIVSVDSQRELSLAILKKISDLPITCNCDQYSGFKPGKHGGMVCKQCGKFRP